MKRLLLAILILASCSTLSQTGTLAGHVTIGPLVPVSREGVPDPTPSAEVYAARQVVILAGNGRTEIERVPIDAQGNYRVTLPAGTYVVDIATSPGRDFGANLPATIAIAADQVTTLDIDVDTGIR